MRKSFFKFWQKTGIKWTLVPERVEMCRQQLMEIKVPEKKENNLSRSSPSSVKLFCWDLRGAKWPKKASSLVSEGLDLAPFLIIVRVWPRREVLRCDHKEDDSSILCSNIDDPLDRKKSSQRSLCFVFGLRRIFPDFRSSGFLFRASGEVRRHPRFRLQDGQHHGQLPQVSHRGWRFPAQVRTLLLVFLTVSNKTMALFTTNYKKEGLGSKARVWKQDWWWLTTLFRDTRA